MHMDQPSPLTNEFLPGEALQPGVTSITDVINPQVETGG